MHLDALIDQNLGPVCSAAALEGLQASFFHSRLLTPVLEFIHIIGAASQPRMPSARSLAPRQLRWACRHTGSTCLPRTVSAPWP